MLGKDGIVCGVFNVCGLLGVNVKVYGKFFELEMVYDYLWCVYVVMLCVGMIGVFNWLYYEDVLVVCVWKFVLVVVIE